MNYTSLSRVKLEAIKTALTTDDTLLNLLIASASRSIDRVATGIDSTDADNYFELADIADELLTGQLDNFGNIVCGPHKPQINTVSSLSYRFRPMDEWQTPASNALSTDGKLITAWTQLSISPKKAFVKVSYNGGYSAATDTLPADIIELATLLTTRLYREAESGLTDVIGVAELGTLMYTKAWPVRFVEMIRPYQRTVGWSKLA